MKNKENLRENQKENNSHIKLQLLHLLVMPQLIRICSRNSQLEILRKLNLLQITSPLLKKTLLREDMRQCCLQVHQSRKLYMKFTKISHILLNFIVIVKLLRCSLRMLAMELRKLLLLINLWKMLEVSIQSHSGSLKFLVKTKDLCSLNWLLRSISNSTNNSTRKKRLQSSLLLNSINHRREEYLHLWRKILSL